MDYDRLRELQEKFEENPRRYFAPLANEYRKGGQPKRAIEICRSQLAQMPGHMSGQIVYGQSLYECSEFEEARQVFERALTLDPENLIALRSLGDMSLQAGDTVEARKWYTRLLEADPKDAVVIALVTEIDESTEAKPIPTPQEIPGVDADGGDQAIPFITDAEGIAIVGQDAPPAAENAPTRSETSSTLEPTAQSPAPQTPLASSEDPPAGLERHYPTEPVSAEPVSAEPVSAEPVSAEPVSTEPVSAEPVSAEPAEAVLFEDGIGAQGLRGGRQDEPMGAEGLRGSAQEPEPVGTEGLKGKAPPQALAGAKSKRSDEEDVLDTWTPPPPIVPERTQPRAEPAEAKGSKKEERMFSGPGPEPFVNETMAQLYLQQGYMQLALRVYYQLADARPDDQALKARIAEIEAADRAAHPDAAVMARVPATARPAAEPPHARETPAREAPVREAPVREPPARELAAREAPAREAPAREAPARQPQRVEQDSIAARAENESIAARQPSVREFFATLGRRRPPRSTGNSSGGARPGNNAPADTSASLASSPPSASLDAVFAGAPVSPSDSRAASRLAGAFSGAPGAARTTPPTPPMPTPRVNQRLPQTQESEEDVAKFRAWLDGLTGE